MNINEFLIYLAGGGGIVVASWLLERSKSFQTNTPQVRQYIFFGVSTVISIIAWAVATYVPVEVIASLTPIFTIVAANFAYIFIGQAFHKTDEVEGKSKTVVP